MLNGQLQSSNRLQIIIKCFKFHNKFMRKYPLIITVTKIPSVTRVYLIAVSEKMEDKVYTDRDIHKMIKIFEKNSDLILNKDRLCGGLGLTIAEKDEIIKRVHQENSGNYGFLSLVLTKWISLNGGQARAHVLIETLKDEGFNSTADEFLATLQEGTTKSVQPTTASLQGSQREFEEFLRMDQHELQVLKSLKFDNIKIRSAEFLKCLQSCTALESFKITRPAFNALMVGRAWLPNLKEFELEFYKGNRSEHKEGSGYSLEHLICFYKTNKSEDIWSTCQQVKVELKYSFTDFTRYILKTNGNGTEIVINPHYFINVVPAFDTEPFRCCKKLGLSWCCTIDPQTSPLPPSITHLSLTEVTLSAGYTFCDALKQLQELSSLHVKSSENGYRRQTIDLFSLPPKMSHLSLEFIQITCSQGQGLTTFNMDLEVLALNKCHLDSKVLNEFNSVFKSISKCYFRPSIGSTDHHVWIKKFMEVEGMALFTVKDLPRNDKGTGFDEIEEILTCAGVPKYLESFSLEKIEDNWRFVEICTDVYSEMYMGGHQVKLE